LADSIQCTCARPRAAVRVPCNSLVGNHDVGVFAVDDFYSQTVRIRTWQSALENLNFSGRPCGSVSRSIAVRKGCGALSEAKSTFRRICETVPSHPGAPTPSSSASPQGSNEFTDELRAAFQRGVFLAVAPDHTLADLQLSADGLCLLRVRSSADSLPNWGAAAIGKVRIQRVCIASLA